MFSPPNRCRRPRLSRCALVCDVPALFLSAFSASQAVSDHSAEQQDFGCAPKENPASHIGLTGSRLPVRIRGTRHPSAMAHRAAITVDVGLPLTIFAASFDVVRKTDGDGRQVESIHFPPSKTSPSGDAGRRVVARSSSESWTVSDLRLGSASARSWLTSSARIFTRGSRCQTSRMRFSDQLSSLRLNLRSTAFSDSPASLAGQLSKKVCGLEQKMKAKPGATGPADRSPQKCPGHKGPRRGGLHWRRCSMPTRPRPRSVEDHIFKIEMGTWCFVPGELQADRQSVWMGKRVGARLDEDCLQLETKLPRGSSAIPRSPAS